MTLHVLVGSAAKSRRGSVAAGRGELAAGPALLDCSFVPALKFLPKRPGPQARGGKASLQDRVRTLGTRYGLAGARTRFVPLAPFVLIFPFTKLFPAGQECLAGVLNPMHAVSRTEDCRV